MSDRLVVVGAGSAGAVIASRVSERSDREVLLLEAGPDYPPPGQLPRDLADGTRNSMRDHDWAYRHRPNSRQVLFDFPRGRVVGGSSAVNTCIALRGQPYDYDEWADLGFDDWRFEDCLPAFKRLETDLDFDNEWHGSSGPIPIRRHSPSELVPWQAGFVEACGELGFPACADHNQPREWGVGPHAMNKVDGQRMSAARGYLTPDVRARDNLRIQAHTLVRRVLFENRRVSGLEVDDRGQVRVIPAKNVVLCGGAINTPGLLLRSGVGPQELVSKLGVELVADRPAVSRQLLDHPGAAIILAPKPGVCRLDHPLIQSLLRYTSEGSEYEYDMQAQAGSLLPLPRIELPFVTLMCCVGKPRGTSQLSFASADPARAPRITSRLFEHPDDRRKGVEAFELLWLLARRSPLRELANFFWPNERVLSDPSAIADFIYLSSGSGYHPCGSVPMSPDGVDGRGRVPPLTGLWVADASIMPTIPSSNTNLPTLMIGERFGELFRDGGLELR